MLPPGETALITLRLPGILPAATAYELGTALRQAQEVGTDYRRAQKVFFARFNAALDCALSGPQCFDIEQLAEVMAGEFLLLEEIGFVMQGFAILPRHAHAVLHLPAGSRLSFAPAIDLLHQRTGQLCRRLVRPKMPPEAPCWQPGWHDYLVADAAKLTRIIAYVGGQARQVGLATRFQAWPYVL